MKKKSKIRLFWCYVNKDDSRCTPWTVEAYSHREAAALTLEAACEITHSRIDRIYVCEAGTSGKPGVVFAKDSDGTRKFKVLGVAGPRASYVLKKKGQ